MKARFHPLSDLALERYLAGELPPAEAHGIEEQAAARPELMRHLRERRAEREAFKLRRPPLPALPAEPRRGVPSAWRALAALAVAATAAVGAHVLVPRGDPGVALRGERPLSVFVAVQRGAEVFAYRPGVLLRPSDRIRLTLTSSRKGTVTVTSRDGRGRTQTLYQAVPIDGETTLPDSLELDDAPGDEVLTVWLDGVAAAEVTLSKERR